MSVARYLVALEYDEDGHELDVEVYLTYDGPDADTLTPEEVEAVFREIVSTGEAPPGWTVETVDWQHGGGPEHHGGIGDLGRFGAVFDYGSTHIGLSPRGQVDEDEDLDEGEEPEE